MKSPILSALALLLLVHAPAMAQSNEVVGRDVQLSALGGFTSLGHSGVFPNGVNGMAEATTSCNVGTGNLPWQQTMDPDHPFISFLIVREMDGRFEQISDRSYIKHGFFATNSAGCGTCQHPGTGTMLGVGCSDTYSTANNGDNFWLGPATEIDPWLGLWDPFCSHFDKGEPAVAPPFDCDGLRSLTASQASALGSVGHRIRVLDQDLNVTGATFYFQGMYTTQGEAEALRNNNLGSRRFTAAWSAPQVKWNVTVPGAGNNMVVGTVLQRWAGSTLASATNGGDDGRVYVAVRVSGPTNGLYHYDYAVHNRDNNRGFKAFRLPFCPGARILNAEFRDVDQNPIGDWTFSQGATELAFTGAAQVALGWNMMFNFRFDSDAAPLASTVVLDQVITGAPGADTVSVATQAPLALYNPYLGAGCANDAPPVLYATGTPPQATIPNPSFGLQSSGNDPSVPVLLVWSQTDGSQDLGGGCTLWMGGVLGSEIVLGGTAISNPSGVASFALGVPNNPVLEGKQINAQSVGFSLTGGPLLNDFELSNGLEVRIGNTIPACP